MLRIRIKKSRKSQNNAFKQLTTNAPSHHTRAMQISDITIQQRLNDIRASAGLSDRKIGDKVGLNQSNVWRLRTGQYKNTTDVVGIRIVNLHAEIIKQK